MPLESAANQSVSRIGFKAIGDLVAKQCGASVGK